MKIAKVIVVGAGGTGSFAIPALARLLAYHADGKDANLTIIDGDVFEEKNRERQMFPQEHVGLNKADATVRELMRSGFPNLEGSCHAQYIHSPSVLAGMIASSREGLVCVIGCVDNDATRAVLMAGIKEVNRPVLYIDGANELDTASLITWMYVPGEPVMSPPDQVYPQYAKPADTMPGGCWAKTPSTPQLITANMASAWGIVQTICNLLDNKAIPSAWKIECRDLKAYDTDEPYEIGD